jgi:dimethylargininase
MGSQLMFSNAIVRIPGKSMIQGLTTANLGHPDYNKAIEQHQSYINTLKKCGLEVIVLPPDENFPDSTFVEDTALLTPHCAIIMNPGAASRKGEVFEITETIRLFYSKLEFIKDPGTAEAGDIMSAGTHYYIGISSRTNECGAKQVINILNKYGMDGSTIQFEKALHLKTGLAYLEKNNLLVSGEFLTKSEFEPFNKIEIPENESYAANCIWVNNTVIIPAGYPNTKQKILDAGYSIKETDVSEFQKIDGGLSCLSLRF